MFLRLVVLLLLVLTAPARAQELLEPDAAFRLSARVADARTMEVRYRIADGYYMYRDKFRFEAEPSTVKLGEAQLPPGKVKKDEYFGDVETYRGDLVIRVPLQVPSGTDAVTLKATSQGCADAGICYPPTAQVVQVALSAAVGAAPAHPAAVPGTSLDETSRIADLLRDAGFWVILATFAGFGLLLAFTPCMFPMIPILSGIIVGHGHNISRGRALTLSTAYVLGMAVAYAVAGVAAGLSGSMLSAALQNAWVLGAFALVFVALSLSMFGFYELQMPTFLQSKLTDEANRQQGGSLHGVVAMGALSAIIAGPCVAAPLAGALLYIAQTRDAALGGAALFAMGLGMGAPLILIGVSARTLLPKAGPWMEGVKKLFGVLLLAVAIWIVSPVLPPVAVMVAWSVLLIVWGVFLHAIDPLPHTARAWARFGKGVGIIALVYGVALLLGALGGGRDPLQPLAFLTQQTSAHATEVKFERVKTVAELEARLASAGRPVMLDFYADWCVSCKEMERFTFSDTRVKERMGRMLLLQADVTANNADDQALLKRFNLFGPPGIVFFDAQGQEMRGIRVVGFQPADQFLSVLDAALKTGERPAAQASASR